MAEPLSVLRERFAQPDAAEIMLQQYRSLLEQYDQSGNIDLNNRPVVRNPDGSISTVRSIGVNLDGRETLLPTVSPQGQNLSKDEAIARYRDTGENLGRFDTVDQANAYAKALHEQQDQQYSKPVPSGFLDAVRNVGAGLARDIPRAANWFYEQAQQSPERAQSQLRGALHGAADSLAKLPQRAFESSERMRTEGDYDPAPMVEAAMLPMGTGAIAGVPLKAGETALGAGIIRPTIAPGDLRASSRFPTAMKATEDPLRQHLNIGVDEMRASPGFEHNVSLLGDYPGFARLKQMDPDAAANAYVDQARGNLQYLYSRSPDVMRERSPHWYDGANEISDALARRWGVPRQSSSAALASLSPQMDWFKNASLGERTGDILTGAAAGRTLTPEMDAFARGAPALQSPKNAELYASIAGKKLDQLDDPLQKALWIRLYDEAHNPRAYREITPEGNFGGFVLNQDQTPAKVGWGALGEVEKAVRSLESGGNMDAISPTLGTKHKVRSFYNNIEVPNDARFGDVTADTHQVAAAQMRPLSGSSPAVAHNLSSGLDLKKQPPGYVAEKSSSVTGAQGTYGLTADATRMMAIDHDMLPRAAQSATWEPVRELFPAKFKTAKNAQAVDDIWRAYDRGDISIEQARDKIYDFAGGIGTPGWARPGLETVTARRGSTYR